MKNKQQIEISLNKPCTEDWDGMTANEQGRHCASCNKTVIDFSLYSDKELLEFFKKGITNVCGHIPVYQLNRVITVQQPDRFTFLRKLAWGTAIAGWLGFNTKAEAQKYTPHPVKTSDFVQGNKRVQIETDSTKSFITLSFYDSKTKKPIQGIYGTMQGTISFSADTSNSSKVYVPDSLIGKKAVFYFYGEDYSAQEIQIDLVKLPIRKKIYLNYEARKVMVNGGLGFRDVNKNNLLSTDAK